ncbi:MAG: asparagine synthase (glutamine-hydrolyzing) [Bacteroidetes bacterium]|nr:asparagine synthase (glutamine-hydrolyzing) [Bacteroidota bacterium]
MCGIAGVIKLENNSLDVREAAQTLSKALRHRGLDDEGFFLFSEKEHQCAYGNDTQETSKNNAFAFSAKKHINEVEKEYHGVFIHRRLSIIDTSPGGYQPMCAAQERLWICFNGELYNYIELREELKKAGYTFYTKSDTEVLLNAYLFWGKDCLQKINGMFAFALYDAEKQEIFCARDRSGVKPFYYYYKNGLFCFASEIKALRALPFVETQVNERALQHYLLHDALEYEEESMLKNVFELFPSYYIVLNLREKTLHKKKYAEWPFNSVFSSFNESDFEQKKQEAEQLVCDAVVKRLRSDVPVACCLSGGIDSSIISGVIAQHHTHFKAFTAVFPNEKIDESFYAKEVVDFTQAQWHTVSPTSTDLINDFETLVQALDIPIWSSSTYAQYRVMQLVKEQNIKVVLDGQGSDELFAGYTHYYTTYINELLRHKQFRQASTEIKEIGNHFWYQYTKENAKRQLQYNRNKKQLNADFVKAHSAPQEIEQRFSSLNEHLMYDFYNHRLKTFLRCEDRCSMHHSVEARTPFADDTPLAHFAFSLPSSYKIQKGVSKYILRQSMQKYMPASVYNRRDKLGFATPHNQWLSDLLEKKQDLLHSSLIKPYFADQFFVKNDRFFAQNNRKKNKHPEKENTLSFKALVLATWLAHMNF